MKSFVFQHEELHCNIYFLVIEAKTHNQQLKKALKDLDKLGFPVNDNVKDYIDEVFIDCTENPGFTFQLTATDVVVGIRQPLLDNDFAYEVGIYAHESEHALYYLYRSIGLDINDDEHMAICIGNIMEKVMKVLIKRKGKKNV